MQGRLVPWGFLIHAGVRTYEMWRCHEGWLAFLLQRKSSFRLELGIAPMDMVEVEVGETN